jgi:hypothetical protein
VLKVTDFGIGFDTGIEAVLGFGGGAVPVSKKEKSADPHGSTLATGC